MENYLEVLKRSLEDKIIVLESISDCNAKMDEVFHDDKSDIDRLDSIIDEKNNLIEKLESLDANFEEVYEKVSMQLEAGRDKYADSIRNIQQLIAQITEKSSSIQKQEKECKSSMEGFFKARRMQIGDGRRNTNAALNYHKAQYGGGYMTPTIMDSKQ